MIHPQIDHTSTPHTTLDATWGWFGLVSPNYSRFICAHNGTDFPDGLWRERRSSKPWSPPGIWAFQGDWPLAVSFSEVTEATPDSWTRTDCCLKAPSSGPQEILFIGAQSYRNLASQDAPDFATSRRHSPYLRPRAKNDRLPRHAICCQNIHEI